MSRKRDPLELFDANDGQNTQLVLDKCLVNACNEGDIDTVIDLLQKGASVDAEAFTGHETLSGENYTTPLMGAAQASRHQHKIASILLENGADVNVGDRYKVTPLHVACVNGHRDCVGLFIDAGANVNAGTLDYNRPGVYRKPYRGQSTPLHLAARDSQVGCVEELLTHGQADYNRRDAYGCTCLNWAAQSASQECVLTVLRLTEGSRIFSNSVPGTGDTPLHDCVRRGFVAAVRELLQRGADVNQLNGIGLAALHFAAVPSQHASPEMTEALVTHARGINVDQPVGGRGSARLPHGMSGIKALQLVAFDPEADAHVHAFHTAEFRLSRTFKLMTSDPRRPMRRPQCAIQLIRYGADPRVAYQGRTLLQQEVYSQDSGDGSLLAAIVRATCNPPVPDRPPGMLPGDLSERAAEKLEWLKDVLGSPRSLQQCCRVAVRRLLGAGKLNRVAELPLPSTLQDYLLLKT